MPEPFAHRIFSLDEANLLVPELTEIFAAIRAEKRVVDQLMPAAVRAAARRVEGGGSRYGARYVRALEHIVDLTDRVAGMGVFIKDLDAGLCDFPHERDGETVLLCWKYGEPAVDWWHGLDDGFRGRRSVDELDMP
ncbi:MAG: DUF2203 domain-containing protein [Leptospirillia bacterium]